MFARHMESRLRENDHKPGWKDDDIADLLYRLREEFEELAHAIIPLLCTRCWHMGHWRLGGHGFESQARCPRCEYSWEAEDTGLVMDEAADVANFAMMIADVAKARGVA